MKSKKLIPWFWVIMMFLSLPLMTSCDDDDDNKGMDKTILEKLADTKWEAQNDGEQIYLKFYDSESNPVELWAYFSQGNCFLRQGGESSLVDLEVQTNTKDNLVIKAIELGNTDKYNILTISEQDSKLKVKSENYDDGMLEDTVDLIFSRSSVDLGSLIVCPLPA